MARSMSKWQQRGQRASSTTTQTVSAKQHFSRYRSEFLAFSYCLAVSAAIFPDAYNAVSSWWWDYCQKYVINQEGNTNINNNIHDVVENAVNQLNGNPSYVCASTWCAYACFLLVCEPASLYFSVSPSPSVGKVWFCCVCTGLSARQRLPGCSPPCAALWPWSFWLVDCVGVWVASNAVWQCRCGDKRSIGGDGGCMSVFGHRNNQYSRLDRCCHLFAVWRKWLNRQTIRVCRSCLVLSSWVLRPLSW